MVLGLAAILALLAVLQYRSSKAVAEATTDQMRSSLQGSLMDVRQGLERELAPLCRELQTQSDTDHQNASQDYLTRFERWRGATAHPNLVADLYLWTPQNENHPAQLLELNPGRTAFAPASWPDKLTRLQQRLTIPERPPFAEQGNPPPGSHPPERPPDGPNRRPPPQSLEFHHRHHTDDSSPWLIDESVPALLHAAHEEPGPERLASGPPALTWVIIVLNRDTIEHEILPELVQRYFGAGRQSSYEIAVLSAQAHGTELYKSDPGFGLQQASFSDATLNLFGPPLSIVAGGEPAVTTVRSSGTALYPATVRSAPTVLTHAATQGQNHFLIEPFRYSQDDEDWKIIAKHRRGSVEAAVAALSHRNLMFNFAVLLVLAATMATIISASQRARRFGELQMDFVSNVSHELRTPLTGIISAAQNIADGVIDDKERLTRYGTAIVNQAHQLTDLVEQILLFSATQKDRHRYHLQPVEIAEVIHASLSGTRGLVQSAGTTVDRSIEPGLTTVSADFKALSQCLQNLIANAVKYGGDQRWIGISATAVERVGGKEIAISVADKGIGIARADLAHIFEPFYRSPEVTAAQIHGSGLGLPLTKRMTEAMGGRITVISECGKGSTFTLYLPAS